MRIPTQQRARVLKFNITPMIDIVFLLIIFFLVASYLASSENSEDLELAHAASGSAEDESARRIVVSITADALIYSAGKIVSLEEFQKMLREHHGEDGLDDFEVRIRADQRVPYQTVEPLLIACAREGVTKLKFNVLPAATSN